MLQRTRRAAGFLRSLKIGPAPTHLHLGTGSRPGAIEKVERCARALQQCFGDKASEPKAARFGISHFSPAVANLGIAGREIGLPNPVNDLGSKTRPIVNDRDPD